MEIYIKPFLLFFLSFFPGGKQKAETQWKITAGKAKLPSQLFCAAIPASCVAKKEKKKPFTFSGQLLFFPPLPKTKNKSALIFKGFPFPVIALLLLLSFLQRKNLLTFIDARPTGPDLVSR